MAEHPEHVATGAGLSFQSKQNQFLEQNRMTLSQQIQQTIELSNQKRIPLATAQQEIVKFQQRTDLKDRLELKIAEMRAPKTGPLSFDERESRINAAFKELNLPIPSSLPAPAAPLPGTTPADFRGTPREKLTEDRPRIRLA